MTTTVQAIGTEAAGQTLKTMPIQRRNLQPDDMQFEVLYCGICHSDLHQINNDFGGSTYPMVPGHEIVGRLTAVGGAVTKFKVGDLAAVGCIVDSCGECPACRRDLQQFSERRTT